MAARLLFSNNALTTLAAPITSSATTATLAVGTGALFPVPGANQAFKLTFMDAATQLVREIVLVSAMSGDTITQMARGQEGTTPTAYLSGDLVANFTTAGTQQQFIQPPLTLGPVTASQTITQPSVISYNLITSTVTQALPSIASMAAFDGRTIELWKSDSSPNALTITSADGFSGFASPQILNIQGQSLVVEISVSLGKYLIQSFGPLFSDYLSADLPGAVTQVIVGGALYPRTDAEIAASVFPTNIFYPGPGQADSLNVKRYGAVGDGAHDDTAAIQTAINVLNNWSTDPGSHNNESSVDYYRGGVVFLPSGTYKITSPILVAPNITLQGEMRIGQFIGTNPSGSTLDQRPSRIVATFSGGVNNYVVDTGNWRFFLENTSTPVTPYRAIDAADQFFASDKDNGIGSSCPRVHIYDLILDGGGTAFGGLRLQMWYYGQVDRVLVLNCNYCGVSINGSFEFRLGAIGSYGPPIGLALQGNESWMQSGGELNIYNFATAAWISANQTLINTVFYTFVQPALLTGAWYGLTLKGILCYWSGNGTVGTLAINTTNVAVDVVNSSLNIAHWENEFITSGLLFLVRHASIVTCDGLTSKSAVPLASGDPGAKLVIRQPGWLACTSTFTPVNGESSSTFEVDIQNPSLPDMLGQQMRFSNVNLSKIVNPIISGSPFTGAVTLFVNSGGSATQDGLIATSPTTIDGALSFIANNPHILIWNLVLKDAQTHTIAAAHKLVKISLFVSRDFSSTAPTLTATSAVVLSNCQMSIASVALSGWTTLNAAFIVEGLLVANIGADSGLLSPAVSIPAGKTLFACAANSTARIILNGDATFITFGAGAGMCYGDVNGYVNYEDSLIQATVTGTAALEAVSSGRVKCIASNLGIGNSIGWGIPTGGAVENNFAGGSASLPITSAALSQLIATLKAQGIIGA